MLLKRLKEQGVEIHTGSTVKGVSAGRVLAVSGEEEVRLEADLAVLAVGLRPNRHLADALANRGVEVHVIGDALEPQGVREAIREGFEVGANL